MISVVIPAYNADKYLRSALESVRTQSYSDFEAIIVNDGSTDGTSAIAAEYAASDGRFRLVERENGGLSDARNCGVGCSNGDWVTFLDSDDELLPDALRILMDAAIDTGCGIVAGGFVRGNEANAVFRRKRRVRTLIIDAKKAVEKTLYQVSGFSGSAWGKLYRKDVLFSEPFRKGEWYEDLDFFYRAYLSVGKVGFVDAAVYFYRENSSSFLNTFSAGHLDVLKVTERLEKYMGEYYPSLLAAARDRRMSANFNILGRIEATGSAGHDRYGGVKAQCREIIRSYRTGALFNSHMRLKNKLGVILSYFGMNLLGVVLGWFYKER